MTMLVEEVLGGAGQTRALEIEGRSGVYRGLCVQVVDAETGAWQRRYVNAVRRSFAELTGEVTADGSVWRGSSPTRTRESRLVSTHDADGTWRRTMSVSEDGGATWRVLWGDVLRRAGRGG